MVILGVAVAVVVGLLGFVITWARGRWLVRRERLLASTRPRCKHGRDKFRGPRCEACAAEDAAFFAPAAPTLKPSDDGLFDTGMYRDRHIYFGTTSIWDEMKHWDRDQSSRAYICKKCRYRVGSLEVELAYNPMDMLRHDCCRPRYHRGQYVRTSAGKIGRIVSKWSESNPCACHDHYRVWMVAFDPGHLGDPWHERKFEPATPRVGEWWQFKSSCDTCGSVGHAPFRWSGELAPCACHAYNLVPCWGSAPKECY